MRAATMGFHGDISRSAQVFCTSPVNRSVSDCPPELTQVRPLERTRLLTLVRNASAAADPTRMPRSAAWHLLVIDQKRRGVVEEPPQRRPDRLRQLRLVQRGLHQRNPPVPSDLVDLE